MPKRFEVWLADRWWRRLELQGAYARKIPAMATAKGLAFTIGRQHVVIDRAARRGMVGTYRIERDGTLSGCLE
jgi:hypothetical protein